MYYVLKYLSNIKEREKKKMCIENQRKIESSSSEYLFVCLNGPQILDPVVGRPLVGFSLKPKGLACL